MSGNEILHGHEGIHTVRSYDTQVPKMMKTKCSALRQQNHLWSVLSRFRQQKCVNKTVERV